MKKIINYIKDFFKKIFIREVKSLNQYEEVLAKEIDTRIKEVSYDTALAIVRVTIEKLQEVILK